ncbi:hypothetical protein [Streptomyces sp. NPDC049040]|uniref:hypothetical protein n=1 Tax=Streptomyces sp. NPDC049040 TaxID=3365593 RepID=UPI00370F83B2
MRILPALDHRLGVGTGGAGRRGSRYREKRTPTPVPCASSSSTPPPGVAYSVPAVKCRLPVAGGRAATAVALPVRGSSRTGCGSAGEPARA